jgi:hypothetical protein
MEASGSTTRAKRNTCVICLEPLLVKKQDEQDITSSTFFFRHKQDTTADDASDDFADVGACYPCGHPCHEACWKEWESFKKRRGIVPCPTCQQGTQSFLKIFLHAEEHHQQQQHPTKDNEGEDTSTCSLSDFSDDDEEEEITVTPVPLMVFPPPTPLRVPCAVTSAQRKHRGKRDKSDTPPRVAATSAATEAVSAVKEGHSEANDEEENNSNSKSTKNNDAVAKTTATRKTTISKNNNKKKSKKVHKKLVQYKRQWKLSELRLKMSESQCRILRLEAKNRQRSHHEDLIELEHSQLLNFRLAKELERVVDSSRFCRNAVALLCFGVGFVLEIGYNGLLRILVLRRRLL